MKVSQQPITDDVEDVARRHTDEAGHVTTDTTSLPVVTVKFEKKSENRTKIRKTKKLNVKVIYDFFLKLTYTYNVFPFADCT